MKTIKIKDLEIIEQEQIERERPQKDVTQVLATLAVENQKKDITIRQLTQTVADLTIEVAKLKGGN